MLREVDFDAIMQPYKNLQPLSREEEQAIARLPREHPDRWKLVAHNMRFLVLFTTKFVKSHKGRILDGWEFVANIQDAMIRASKSFEPRGFKFISYAINGMRWAALDAAQVQGAPVRLPKWGKSTEHLLRESNDYHHFLNHIDPMEELERHVNRVEGHKQVSPDTGVQNRERNTFLTEAMELLVTDGKVDHREREVITRYFSDEQPTLREIGKDLGISKERVRQLKERALRKMRRSRKLREVIPSP